MSKLNPDSTTRLQEYIKEILPWEHGHQIKAITAFVAAILDKHLWIGIRELCNHLARKGCDNASTWSQRTEAA